MNIVISSGHGLHVRGASGFLDEVDEARKIVDQVARDLQALRCGCIVFHDDVSETQGENLDAIVDFHNSCVRDLDVSVHLNAYKKTDEPMGTEVLYVTQSDLAKIMSEAIANAGGFINRGPKHETDLAFLNGTNKPAILIEVCFVDSKTDSELYGLNFAAICASIAKVLYDWLKPASEADV